MRARCLSIRQPWAELIARAEKVHEYRSWTTSYRGPLLICASLAFDECDELEALWGEGHELEPDPVLGATVCLVDLVAVDALPDGTFAWRLERPLRLPPIPVRGRLGLFPPPAGLLELMPAEARARIGEVV